MKEKLQKLIKEYEEFDFIYAACGGKKPVAILPSHEIVYRVREVSEIEHQTQKRKDFEALSQELVDAFIKDFESREIPEGVRGADVIAGYIPKEKSYLYDFALQILDATTQKCDPGTAVCILQTMELALLHKGKPAQKGVEIICKDVLPKIAIATGHDTSAYIPHICSRFCLLGESTQTFVDYYEQAYSAMKSQLPLKQPTKDERSL